MKTISTVHYRVSRKDKKKGLLIWAFVLFLGIMTAKGQLDVLYMEPAHAETVQDGLETPDDRLGQVLDPKGTIYIKQGEDPAWGKIKEPRLLDVSAYTSRVQETDSTPCIPADGSNICDRFKKGEKMVAYNCAKLGSKLKIGDTVYTVVDRLNPRYTASCRIDIYYGYDLKGALKHGVKKLMVTEL